jgi:hypothetical protein
MSLWCFWYFWCSANIESLCSRRSLASWIFSATVLLIPDLALAKSELVQTGSTWTNMTASDVENENTKFRTRQGLYGLSAYTGINSETDRNLLRYGVSGTVGTTLFENPAQFYSVGAQIRNIRTYNQSTFIVALSGDYTSDLELPLREVPIEYSTQTSVPFDGSNWGYFLGLEHTFSENTRSFLYFNYNEGVGSTTFNRAIKLNPNLSRDFSERVNADIDVRLERLYENQAKTDRAFPSVGMRYDNTENLSTRVRGGYIDSRSEITGNRQTATGELGVVYLGDRSYLYGGVNRGTSARFRGGPEYFSDQYTVVNAISQTSRVGTRTSLLVTRERSSPDPSAPSRLLTIFVVEQSVAISLENKFRLSASAVGEIKVDRSAVFSDSILLIGVFGGYTTASREKVQTVGLNALLSFNF